jgi:hypothetical protein
LVNVYKVTDLPSGVFPKGFLSIAIGVAGSFSFAITLLPAHWAHKAIPALATKNI